MTSARFRYNHPSEDYLEVTAETGEFRGRGVAEAAFRWGIQGSVRQFIEALKSYPAKEATLSISDWGGIHVRVQQTNPLGHLEMEFRLYEEQCGSEAIIRFAIDYEGLKTFSKNLERMVDTASGDFTVTGFSRSQTG